MNRGEDLRWVGSRCPLTHALEDIRVSSSMKLTMRCCVKSHGIYYVILHELVVLPELYFAFLCLKERKVSLSPFAQSFSHAKAQQGSDNLPQHEMHEVYQSMTRGRLYRFFNGVVITKSSIDMYCT